MKRLLFLLWFSQVFSVGAAGLIDDRLISIRTFQGAKDKRAELIRYLWGTNALPKSRQPDVVETNIPSPVKNLSHLARVDSLRMNLAPGLEALAYHFVPVSPNSQAVVVHHGHACTLDDAAGPKDVGYGLQRTIHALLQGGFGVLGVFMPHMRPGDCIGEHDKMFETNTVGSPIKFFLEPTLIGLNHLRSKYKKFHMVGLSGGGWTTTVYAAIDPVIECSFPVAGTIPLYLRSSGSVGDREQYEPSFYRLAGYQDLYILGVADRGRKQVQILVRRDDCCFGEAQHDAKGTGKSYTEAMREYERGIHDSLKWEGAGEFRLVIDETAPSHMISHHAITNVILKELTR